MLRVARGLVLLLLPGLAWGQAGATSLAYWHHTSWTGDAGPPLPGEHLLLRGGDGYLWLSGAGGIMRFDGRRFTVLDSIADPALATKQGFLSPVLVDRKGTTWIRGPETALLAYTRGVVRTVVSSGIDGSVTEDGAGRLWVRGERFGILRDGRIEDGHLPIDLPLNEHFGVQADTGTGLWIGTRSRGLYHVIGDSVRRYGSGRIRVILQSRDGVVWAIGTGLGPGLWRLEGERWRQVTLSNPTRSFIARFAKEDADGAIWFPTSTDGVVRWHAGVVEQFTRREGLSSDRVHDIEVDRAGTVWVSTDAGIDRLQQPPFITIGPRGGLPVEQVQAIAQDSSGTMWLAGTRGSMLYELRNGIALSPIALRTREQEVHRPFRLLGASRTGGAWLATDPGGLIHWRARGRVAYGSAEGFPPLPVLHALEGRDGTVWVHLSGGEVGRMRSGRYTTFAPSGRVVSDVVSHAEDGHGRSIMWPRYSRVLLVARDDAPLDSIPLPGDSTLTVTRLTVEGGDTLWGVTRTGALRIVGLKASVAPVPDLQRLLSTAAHVEVAQGWLYFANTSGIARVALKALHRAADGDSTPVRAHVLDPLDGIPTPRAPSLVPKPLVRGIDGRLWCIVPDGLCVSNPGYTAPVARPAMVHIEEVERSDAVIPLANNGTIAPNPDRLAIHFTVTNVALPERAVLSWRLEGAEDQWTTGLARVATWTRLRPGSYRFRVRAVGEDGVPAAAEASLAFRVLPAWYQAWWFIGLAVLAVAGSGSLVALTVQRGRVRRNAERTEARFEAVLAERTRIARELHDTLLQRFTGITLHLEGIRSAVAQKAPATADELGVILRDADATLREARETVWDMRAPDLAESDLGEALEAAARQAINGDGVKLRVDVAGVRRRLPPVVETTLLRIGREALGNAIRHADPTTIAIALTYAPDRVALVVKDDGRGADANQIETAAARGHWGVAGMHERAARAGGTVEVRTAPGEGTIVTASLPAPA